MKRLIVLSFCLLFLTGCATKLTYNFLDFLLNWYVDTYVSLDKTQKKRAKTVIKDFHKWHRETQLVIYANYIDGLVERISDTPATEKSLHDESDIVQTFIDSSAEKLIPDIVDILSTFSDEQVEELLANLKKEREKYHKEFIAQSREDVIKVHQKDVKKYIKPFFGRLTKEQKKKIEEWGKNLVEYEEYSLAQQEISAKELEEGLANRTDKEQLEKVVRRLLFYRSDDWIKEYREATDVNQELTFTLLAELYNSQSEKQRKKTIAKLRNYQKDFIDLANKKKPDLAEKQLVSTP